MSVNIFDLVKGYITPNVVTDAANKLGESESGVTKAISAFIPLILGSLISKKDDSGLLGQVKDLAKNLPLDSLGSFSGSDSPLLGGLLSNLLGDHQSGILSKISEFAGIKDSSASSLLNLAGAAGLGGVGKYAEDNNLNDHDFSDLLGSAQTKLAGLLPAGLSLGALGLGGLGNLFDGVKESASSNFADAKESVQDFADNTKETVSHKVDEVKEKFEDFKDDTFRGGPVGEDKNSGGGFLKWLIPLLLLLLIGYLLYNWLGKKDKDKAVDETVVVDSIATDAGDDLVVREEAVFDLDGVSLKGYKGGLEDQLVTFVKSDDYKNGTEDTFKDKWFNFDNVNFVFGKTDQLEPGSEVQLQNLAAILKKFPDAKIKIGAYSDKKGDDATNKDISQKRADYLKAELGKLGVGAQVVSAEGYGEEFATVPETASDEERAVDRKMALRFTK